MMRKQSQSITITQEESYHTSKSRSARMYFSFVCDVSGSMDGSKIQAAQTAFKDIVETTLEDSDYLEVMTFASRVNNKQCGGIMKRAFNPDRVSFAVGGSTVLYDAIFKAIDDFPRNKIYKGCQCEMIILTDGEDTGSVHSYEEAKQKIAKPGLKGFHLILIGVGIAPEAEVKLEALCKPAHCRYMKCGNSATEIAKLFKRAKKEISERRVTFSVTYTAENLNAGNPRLSSGAGIPDQALPQLFERLMINSGPRPPRISQNRFEELPPAEPTSPPRLLPTGESPAKGKKENKRYPAKGENRQPQEQAFKLWVGNIPTAVTKADAIAFFKPRNAWVLSLKQSKGLDFQHAILSFSSADARDHACRNLKGVQLRGCTLEVRVK